ncbi:DUF5997 family protein [Mariniluteicoccus flavus]
MSQTMKPVTAAQKLGVLLTATPESFQSTPITRQELDDLRADPPEWLVDLRRNGPFPRDVTAAKLGVSNSGLARGGITEPLNADQIGELIADPPQWLVTERETHRKVIAENERLRDRD